jgi:ABC-type polysaccharide/polyol phosphate export permease
MDGTDLREERCEAALAEATPERSQRASHRRGFWADVSVGLRCWPGWLFKGWYDIVLRYRRTAIGPLWLVITTGVMIACLTLVGPILFGGGDPNFIPYMVAGVLSWTFLSLAISETSGAFIENAGDIRAVHRPYSTHLFRVIMRNVIIYFHLLIIYVIALLLHMRVIVPHVPWFVIGLGLDIVWLFATGYSLAVLCARFRDVQQLIHAVLQVAFLLTPVFWDKSLLLGKSREWVVQLNPLHHLLEVIRSPLLGGPADTHSYLFTAGGIVIGGGVSIALHRRWIPRVPFWL